MISLRTFLSTSSSFILFLSSQSSSPSDYSHTRFDSSRFVFSLTRLLPLVHLIHRFFQSEYFIFEVRLLFACCREVLFESSVFDSHSLKFHCKVSFIFFVFSKPLEEPVHAIAGVLVSERISRWFLHGRTGHLAKQKRTLSSSAPRDSFGPPLGVALNDFESENSRDSVLFG